MALYIYGLVDPLVHQIAYVGQTERDIYERWEQHVKTKSESLAGRWVKRLRAAGLQPTLIVLEVLPDNGDIDNAERWWIAHGLRMGWPLVNTQHVGERRIKENYSALSKAISAHTVLKPNPQPANGHKRRQVRAHSGTRAASRPEPKPESEPKPKPTEVPRCLKPVFDRYYDGNGGLKRGGLVRAIFALYPDGTPTGGPPYYNAKSQVSDLLELYASQLEDDQISKKQDER